MANLSYRELDTEIRKVLVDHPGLTCGDLRSELDTIGISISYQRASARLKSLETYGYVKKQPHATIPHCYVYSSEAIA